MKKFALMLCVLVAVLIAAGFAQERSYAVETPTVIETANDICKKSQGEILRKLSEKPCLPEEDLELLALVVVAEAEGESELGQRLVCDTILNRVDSPYFPDTISDVIWQRNQYESMWNGRANRCVVTDAIRNLVRQEYDSRQNNDVVFFRTNHYSTYGSPLFQEGNHYFSSL